MIDVPLTGAYVAWIGMLVLLAIALLVAALGVRFRMPALGVVGLVPLALAALGLAFGIQLPPPHPVLWPLLAIGLAALGVLGGNPLTVFVLGLADGAPKPGAHGGIVVPAEKGSRGSREVLRGGAVIGYLERTAIVVAIALGRFEIVAGVIAIKGLGRFTELDSAEARERFIIGTLTSMIWAAGCGGLIALSRLF